MERLFLVKTNEKGQPSEIDVKQVDTFLREHEDFEIYETKEVNGALLFYLSD